MKIELKNIGKRFNYEWIFRNVNYEFTGDNNYVIMGANGSGKSTLLQVIAGSLIPSDGTISYEINQKKILSEDIYSYLSIATPYDSNSDFVHGPPFDRRGRRRGETNRAIDDRGEDCGRYR